MKYLVLCDSQGELRNWEKRKRRTGNEMIAQIELPTGVHKDYQNGLLMADKRLAAYYEGSDVRLLM